MSEQTPETVRLPETVEELQRERRAAFEDGARWAMGSALHRSVEEIAERVRFQYPIRKQVPREVLASGHKYRIENGALMVSVRGSAFVRSSTPLDEVVAVAGLIADPYKWVEE